MMKPTDEKKIANIELEKIEKAWMEKVSKVITTKFAKELKEKNYPISTLIKDINFELQLVDFTSQKIQDFTLYMEDVVRSKLDRIKGGSEMKERERVSAHKNDREKELTTRSDKNNVEDYERGSNNISVSGNVNSNINESKQKQKNKVTPKNKISNKKTNSNKQNEAELQDDIQNNQDNQSVGKKEVTYTHNIAKSQSNIIHNLLN